MPESNFDYRDHLPDSVFSQITEVRVSAPGVVEREAAARTRRRQLTATGKLVILAADHPGRGVTKAGEDPLAMGNRQSYLARILRVLAQPGIDGIMSTPDILEELLILEHLLGREHGRLLDGKLMIGCMNRGGIAGAVFEMHDRFGAYTAAGLKRMGLDGAKMMFRLDPENPDSGATIQACSEALKDLQSFDLPAFLEPLMVKRSGDKYQVQKTAGALITAVGIASALGNSSRYLWLKIPYCEGYAEVARATTCPILMLGGESRGNVSDLLRDFATGLRSGPNVRGLLVGRNILFPGAKDPGAMAAAVAALVHENAPPERAMEILSG